MIGTETERKGNRKGPVGCKNDRRLYHFVSHIILIRTERHINNLGTTNK